MTKDGARSIRTAYREKYLTSCKVVRRGPNGPTSTVWRAHSENGFCDLEERVSLHENLVAFHIVSNHIISKYELTTDLMSKGILREFEGDAENLQAILRICVPK
jgi:hypothetical protein